MDDVIEPAYGSQQPQNGFGDDSLSPLQSRPDRVHRGSTVYGHQPVLDGLRGVAILLVMFVHLTVMDSGTLVDRAFYRISTLGWVGVDLFFVLSGFLITGILYDSRNSPHFFRNFYVRRILRIFPLYYAVVVVALVLLPRWPGVEPPAAAWTYWVFLSNFAVAWQEQFPLGILVVVWSLAIEEQFYVVWAPVVRWLTAVRLVRACLALIVGAIVFRVILSTAGAHPAVLYVLPFARMDALALGALLAILARRPGGLHPLARRARVAGPSAAVAVVAIAVWENNSRWSEPVMQTLGYSCLAVLFGALLVMALAAPPGAPIRRVLMMPALRRVGIYSYSMYLLHLPLRAVVRDHVFGPSEFPTVYGSQLPGQLLFYFVAAVPVITAAWLSWHLYEQRFLALKKHFPLGSAPAVAMTMAEHTPVTGERLTQVT